MNEDFVSFDLAKKLKEKGFPQYTEKSYFVGDHKKRMCSVGTFLHIPTQNTAHLIAAPTIAQVLKWMREEKKIHICIDIYDDGWFFDIASFYKEDTEVYEIEWPYISSNVTPHNDSYEQAAIAGIEYCLDNLI